MRPSPRRALRPVASLATLLALAACGADAVPTAALEGNVVDVGSARLSGKQLEEWLMKSPQLPTEATSALIVSAWIDMALLDNARRTGAMPEDSATVDAAIAPDAARGTILEFWQKRSLGRPAVTDKQADSLAVRDEVRVYQHFFLTLPQGTDSAIVVATLNKAAGILDRARKGESFAKLVREASQDSGTIRRDGFLPAVRRSDLPPALARIAWELQPGEVSKLIPSTMGLHLVRRATKAESMTGYKEYLGPRFARRSDSLFVDSLTRARKLTLGPDAVARTRAIAPEPMIAAPGDPLMTWEGGRLTPESARTWMTMLSAPDRAILAVASDSAIVSFLREMAQRELILGLASPGSEHGLSAKARAALTPQYKAALAAIYGDLDRTGGAAAADGNAAAKQFMDSVVTNAVRYRPLPGGLAGVLRSRAKITVDGEALAAVLRNTRTIWMQRRAADSLAGKLPPPPAAPPAGAPAPAPGGAPVQP